MLVGSNMNDTVPSWSPDWGRYFLKTKIVGGGSMKEDMQKNAGTTYAEANPKWYEACQRETLSSRSGPYASGLWTLSISP